MICISISIPVLIIIGVFEKENTVLYINYELNIIQQRIFHLLIFVDRRYVLNK